MGRIGNNHIIPLVACHQVVSAVVVVEMESGLVKNIPVYLCKQVVDLFHIRIEIDCIKGGNLIRSQYRACCDPSPKGDHQHLLGFVGLMRQYRKDSQELE